MEAIHLWISLFLLNRTEIFWHQSFFITKTFHPPDRNILRAHYKPGNAVQELDQIFKSWDVIFQICVLLLAQFRNQNHVYEFTFYKWSSNVRFSFVFSTKTWKKSWDNTSGWYKRSDHVNIYRGDSRQKSWRQKSSRSIFQGTVFLIN